MIAYCVQILISRNAFKLNAVRPRLSSGLSKLYLTPGGPGPMINSNSNSNSNLSRQAYVRTSNAVRYMYTVRGLALINLAQRRNTKKIKQKAICHSSAILFIFLVFFEWTSSVGKIGTCQGWTVTQLKYATVSHVYLNVNIERSTLLPDNKLSMCVTILENAAALWTRIIFFFLKKKQA